ncbi:adenosine deaminase-like protein [Novymonas esmeraldas]|uniref:tRNA-specific adenosine deaminase 1 n=1 Tax=Novymonas esmeraldas TaxID=1808958 RepID=A0AAW0ESS5_9TRYP
MQRYDAWIAPRLWCDSPQAAVQLAVEAQQQSVWRQLWRRALEDGVVTPSSSLQPAPRSPDTPASASGGGDGSVVVAAFVLSVGVEERSDGAARETQRRYVCVSLGSGTRCLASHEAPPSTAMEEAQRLLELRDGHAEVMARRGLIAFLLEMAAASVRCGDGAASCPLLRRCSGGDGSHHVQWDLCETVAVHLLCSRWMCGSLAAVAGGTGRSGHLLLRSACGCWLSPSVEAEVVADAEPAHASCAPVRVGGCTLAAHHSSLNSAAPLLQCARVKPGKGRANLSMSCTDKVWRWCALGVQGRRRECMFPVPMRLSSIHVLQPSSADRRALELSLSEAAATLQWRCRRWRSPPDSDGAATPPQDRTPVFAYFDGAALRAASPPAGPVTDDPSMQCDSSYSRSRWLCFAPTVAPRKRSRGEVPEGCGAASCTGCCDWQPPAVSGSSCGSLVLNTKAGLPQGMSARSLRVRCHHTTAAELPWRLCPLSRPWMAHRLAEVQAALDAALPSLLQGAAQERVLTPCVASAAAGTAALESMSARLHRCHGRTTDSARLLWASPCHDAPDATITAPQLCRMD